MLTVLPEMYIEYLDEQLIIKTFPPSPLSSLYPHFSLYPLLPLTLPPSHPASSLLIHSQRAGRDDVSLILISKKLLTLNQLIGLEMENMSI